MPGETGAAAAGAGATNADAVDPSINAEVNAEGGEGESDGKIDAEFANGEGKPVAKPKAKSKADAAKDDDPDLEWEEPGPDEKTPGTKHKMKLSEAKKELAALKRTKAEIAKDRAALQKYHDEQLTPLERDIAELRANPSKLIDLSRRLGIDPRKALEDLAREELKLLNMTPEQRRVYELEQELARRDQAEKAEVERQKAEKAAQENQRVQKTIADGILKAASDAKLPKHPMALSLMSAFLRAQVNNGQHPDPAEAAQAVQEFALDYTKKSISSLTYDQLVDTFPDVVKKIREGDSGRVADQPATRVPRPPPKPKVTRPMSPAEFTARMLRGE